MEAETGLKSINAFFLAVVSYFHFLPKRQEERISLCYFAIGQR